MDRKYQVFISSTYHDLKEERMEIMEALINLGHIPVGMELFNAADDTQWGVIKRRIDESDYYVLILSDRYGSVDDDGIGFTEKEYDYAISKGIPVISFIRDEQVIETLDFKLRESEHRKELDNFKKKLSKRLYKIWSDKHDLAKKFFLAFSELEREKPRSGWVKADSIGSISSKKVEDLLDRNNELIKHNEELRKKLEEANRILQKVNNLDRLSQKIIAMAGEKIFDFGFFQFNGKVLINLFTPFVSAETTYERASDGIREFIGKKTGENPSRDLVRSIIGAFSSLGLIKCESKIYQLHREDSHRGDKFVRDEIKTVEKIIPTELLPRVFSQTEYKEYEFPKKHDDYIEKLKTRLEYLKNFKDDATYANDDEDFKRRRKSRIDSVMAEFITIAKWNSEEEKIQFMNMDFANDERAIVLLFQKADEALRIIEAEQGASPDRYSAGAP